MNYLRIPHQVTFGEIRARDTVWSPSMYRKVIIPSTNLKRVSDLLSPSRPFDKGNEPGSLQYLNNSPYYFIRTKSLQEHSYLLYPKGDAIIPINPKVFKDHVLSEGDILMSKDSNVGECAIIDSNNYRNHMFSGGIVRLHPIIDKYYFFSFLKHELFKTQLLAMAPRGATITHAKTLWLSCFMPFPNQSDSDRVIRYVSVLMQSIIEKEKAIRDKSDLINNIIQKELDTNQKSQKFKFSYPSISDVLSLKRLDAIIYDHEYKSKIWLIENYELGYESPEEADFIVKPGPSLEIKIIRTRIDSEKCLPGYYTLILPTNISIYGTMNTLQYLGTGKSLPILKAGDIVFGEAGFHKGRSIVILDQWQKCTTNAHGLYARRHDGDIKKSIFFRCIFNWYRTMRLIDIMAVGGSGGHFSPEYFNYIRIPKFPIKKQEEISNLYHNKSNIPCQKLKLDNFVEWHREFNKELGIWELDYEMKNLQFTLSEIQDLIISGEKINVPL